MTLTREKAIRLSCNAEIAGKIPPLAILFEMCESEKREAKKKAKGCGGCDASAANLLAIGDQTLTYLSSAPEEVIGKVKRYLSAQSLIIQINGVKVTR